MPELPEVETIARGLAPLVVGRRIVEALVSYAPVVGGDAGAFREKVRGRHIRSVRRRGKLLILDLEGDVHLAIHLRMTGRITVDPETGLQPDKHTHVILRLEGGDGLVFNDQRKFGRCLAFSGAELEQWPFLARLGPEPLQIGPEEFVGRFLGRGGRIKGLLLNQEVLAGIGNIYADESLFGARIHPAASAKTLGRRELLELHQCLRDVLEMALQEGGSSFRDYVNALGQRGGFQERFAVYGRKGFCCTRCRTLLETVQVAGRTSTFCPACQPDSRQAAGGMRQAGKK
jgi:formamidopyrimidine-DNA glycosylase